jgi:Flp pilus assembly protein TadG
VPVTRRSRSTADTGAAVVDFVLLMVLVVPLVLGVVQLGLVLHVRNTLTAAASEGARYASTIDRGPDDGAARTREVIGEALSARYAEEVTAASTTVDGLPGVVVRVHAEVPALGLFGPSVELEVAGHAVEEQLP